MVVTGLGRQPGTQMGQTMLEYISTTFIAYMAFYSRFLTQQWTHMTPVKYGIMLIGIGVFGWFLMKSGTKRS